MTRPFARIRSRHQKTAAFTLVEMLVVITIIAVLAALLIPAVISAQRRAQSTRIKMEIDQLATGFEDYRNDVAGEYPPNCWYVNPQTHNANAVVRHFKKAFPRHREPEALIRGLAGYGGTGPQVLPGGLNPAEAVFFWLGGFSSDPKYPISGPGGPSFLISQADNIEDRNRTYDFDLARLGAGAGIDVKTALQTAKDDVPGLGITTTQAIADNKVRGVKYEVTIPGQNQDESQTRLINFWQYYPPKSTNPFVYFDTSKSRPSTIEDTFYLSSFGVIPIKRLAVDGLDIRYANEDKYQILHAGVDDDWGNFTQVGTIMYPDGPFTAELGDTVVNFDERTLQDAQP